MKLYKFIEDNYWANPSTNKPKILSNLAKGYSSINNFDEVIRYYKILLEQYPDSEYAVYVPYFLGEIYAKLGDYEQALNWMEQQSILHPDNQSTLYDPLMGKAMIYFNNLRDFPKAADIFEEQLKLQHSQRETQSIIIRLASCYENMGDKLKAVSLLNDLLVKFPDSTLSSSVSKNIKRIEEEINNEK